MSPAGGSPTSTSSSDRRITPTSSEDGSVATEVVMGQQPPTPGTSLRSESFSHTRLRGNENENQVGLDSGVTRSSLTPNHAITTYRDLHNATPSPNMRPPEASRGQPSTPSSPSPCGADSVRTEIRGLSLGEDTDLASGGRDLHTDGDSGDEASENDYHNDGDDGYLYNIRQEELPRAPIYDLRLQNALRELRSQLTDLTRTMQRSGLAEDHNSMFYELYKQTLEASQFAYPETRLVGFIGDSGVGKSTLINSLLDRQGLARSSGDGAACTTVVTEFRHVDERHPQQYTIEAEFMNRSEIRELLEELLRSFRNYYTNIFDEVRENHEEIKAAALRAQDTLKSLFPNDPKIDHEYLSAEGMEKEKEILEHLQELAMGVLRHRPGERDSEQYLVVAYDDEDCKDRLDELTTDLSGTGPAIWPFPGFRDLNYARERATEKYLRHHCDEVFIVSTIIRCTTDPAIKDIINRCARNQPVRIICTRSEEVNPKETARNPETPEEIRERIHDFLNEIKALESSMRGIRSPRCDRLLITRRNRQITQALSREQNDRARVFCVSNTLYLDNREGDQEQANDYIALSGIPELRQYCQSVPADAQLRSTEAFLKNQAPAVLGSLTQWALARSDSITAGKAETLRRVLTDAESIIRTQLVSRQSEILSMENGLRLQFKNLIIREIRDIQSYWRDGAIEASMTWESYHPSSYLAWCRNNGTHTTLTVGYRCWNTEILQPVFPKLRAHWDQLLGWIEEQNENIEDRVCSVFETISDSISAKSPQKP
ncbi:hypothetical protein BDV59DRAFT_195181 [Aspergillus ambiguus]|uniref:uncharacterized protein n=1 Tax=Aspergillus ambiguus TaxID=176160 RepID=UPI003CCCC639